MPALPSAWQLRQAARAVEAGGVIAYPTEAVWGLGCDPWDALAVQRLLALKDRPVEKGLILIAGCIDDFAFLLDGLPAEQRTQLAQSWPGPNTWLVPHHGQLPYWLCGQHPTIALRVTDHPAVQALCALTGPLVSTSANPTGRPAARSRLRVQQYFGEQLDGVLNAPLGGRKNPSLIRELATGRVIRAS